MSKYEEKFADLKAGDGDVKEIGGKMVAASRDDQGDTSHQLGSLHPFGLLC